MNGEQPNHVLRRKAMILALIIVIGAMAAALWFVWVPNWRPPLREGERYGIPSQLIRAPSNGIE